MRETHPETLTWAAERFTRALAAEAMLRCTARIEAIVHAAEAEAVFLFEAALRRAWPPASGEAPPREVMWAAGRGADTVLHLQAFDAGGRLLLRRTYEAEAGAGAAP